jgi:hypothetical protein
MKNIVSILILSAHLSYSLFSTQVKATSWNTIHDCLNGLCLESDIPNRQFSADDERNIDVSTVFTNKGSTPIVISPYRRLRIEIQGKGASRTFLPVPPRPAWDAKARYVLGPVVVEPGETYTYLMKGLCDGDQCWGLGKGTYRIATVYSMTEDDASFTADTDKNQTEELKAKLWIGTVESKVIDVKII